MDVKTKQYLGFGAIIILFAAVLFVGLGGKIPQAQVGGLITSLSPTSTSLTNNEWNTMITMGAGSDNFVGRTTYATPDAPLVAGDKTSQNNLLVTFTLDELNVRYPLQVDNLKSGYNKKIQYITIPMTDINNPKISADCRPYAYATILGGTCSYIMPACVGDSNWNFKRLCTDAGGVAVTCTNPVKVNGWTIPVNSVSGWKCEAIVDDVATTTHPAFYKPTGVQDNMKATITTTVNGKTETLVLSPSNGALVNTTSDGLVTATITGALLTFNQHEPQAADFYVVASDNGAMPIGKDAYNQIPTSLVFNAKWKTCTTASCIDTELNAYKTAYATATISAPNSPFDLWQDPFGKQPNLNSMIKVDRTQLVMDRLAAPMVYPQVQLKIKADYLQAVTPISNASIVDYTCPAQTNENTQGVISMTVKNNGATGQVTPQITCNPTIQFDNPQQGLGLNNGETHAWNYYYSAAQGVKTCTLKVLDAKGVVTDTRTCNIEIVANVVQSCPQGKIWSSHDLACVCDQEGLSCTAGYNPNYQTCACDKQTNPPADNCVNAPRTLKENELWIPKQADGSGCYFKCATDYNYAASGDCVKSGCPAVKTPCATGYALAVASDGCAKCMPSEVNESACSYPLVWSSSTTLTQSPFAGLPVIGEFFKPTATTTKTCNLDPNLLVLGGMLLIGGIAVYYVYTITQKKGGKKK